MLGVFGLSFRTSQNDLEDLFGKFGRLERVNLVMDKYRDASRGFGFIYFEKQEDATAAKEAMNDSVRMNGNLCPYSSMLIHGHGRRTTCFSAARCVFYITHHAPCHRTDGRRATYPRGLLAHLEGA